MTFKFKKRKSKKEELIDRWIEDAIWHDAGSDEARIARENIVGLIEAEPKRKCTIDTNAIISGAVTLLGVLMITHSEKTEIISQKGFSLVSKMFKHH